MAEYSASISRVDCPSSVWATITAEAAAQGGHGGSSGPQATGGSNGSDGKPNAAPGDSAVPIVGGMMALFIGVVAVLL
jgi:hypothetical protein